MSPLEIHDAALAIGDPAARKRYLDEACVGEAEVRRRVEAMLRIADVPQGSLPGDVMFPPGPERRRIGRYRLVHHVGRGTFGDVWQGWDDELDRAVAIKLPNPEWIGGPEAAESFLREAKTAAALEFDNLVRVYDVGRLDDGAVFIVSQYIDGPTLRERLERGRPAAEETARIAATVARALHHAHTHGAGLVHRDIKPANILIDDARGVPYLADFGISIPRAKSLADTQIAGTPAYMSPEQTLGEKIDARSDIFALGVVLYEMLTGAKAFGGRSLREMQEQVARARPMAPRDCDPSIPGELERICLRSMAKVKADRYPSALLLAEDLEAWLAERSRGAVDENDLPVRPKGLRSFDGDDAQFFLQLLPGPRGRDGLPESVRFWKTRLDETDPHKTFPIGLLYGPSGCGKSSLVKAGIVPRLNAGVRTVVLEASGDDTEERLVKALRRVAPDLPAEAGLAAFFARLRDSAGSKIVVILDQFEQWLQTHPDPAATGLVAALRHCDGGRVQAIVLVRDDFCLAANRFMQAMETPIEEGRNYATIDSFPVDHARGVLVRFGQGLGRLPRVATNMSDEETTFVDRATSGLAEEAVRVVPVHLALFAEMVKARVWTPATIQALGVAVGGSRRFLDRVGVAFLEESLHGRAANPSHRVHAEAAKRVLEALLPESRSAIKGRKRSEADLLAASGYAGRRGEFNRLLGILDVELRLITPTDPPGDESSGIADGREREPHYQLTHDYLVPALRDWLTSQRRLTARGRTELVLAERTAFWSERKERQQLPSLVEWLRIRWLTVAADWRLTERRMMARADRYHGFNLAIVAALLAVTGIVGGLIRSRNTAERFAAETARLGVEARGAVDALLASGPDKIEDNLAKLAAPSIVGLTGDKLAAAFGSSVPGSVDKLRAAIALAVLDRDEERPRDFIVDRLLDRESPIEPEWLGVIVRSLGGGAVPFTGRLRDAADGLTGTGPDLAAAAVLAAIEPEDAGWQARAPKVAEALVKVPLVHLRSWREAFRGVRGALVPALTPIAFDGERRDGERSIATDILADYAAGDAEVVAELAMRAEPWQFATFAPLVNALFGAVAPRLEAELKQGMILDDAPASDPRREALAIRQAKGAAVLVRFGRPEGVWKLFRHAPDPRLRSHLIHLLGPFGADPQQVYHRLEVEPELSARRGLVLALGEMASSDGLLFDRTSGFRETVASILRRIHDEDPDPGLHAAAEWTLRQLGEQEWIGERVRAWKALPPSAPDSTDPGDPLRLATLRAEIADSGSKAPRWYVNRRGQTFIIVPEPGPFLMGSPASEDYHEPDSERQHERRISRSFAIGMKPVTLGEYQELMGAWPIGKIAGPRFARSNDLPVVGVTWFMAAAYCNALSRAEGLPESELVYEEDDVGRIQSMAPGWLSRSGYRLPTEAEWEYTARAGASTSRFFGETGTLLDAYAWNERNSRYSEGSSTLKKTAPGPVGWKKPNDLGLFDALGNVWNWCQDEYADAPSSEPGKPIEDVEGNLKVTDTTERLLRGSGFGNDAPTSRVAQRAALKPSTEENLFGFRVARSLPGSRPNTTDGPPRSDRVGVGGSGSEAP